MKQKTALVVDIDNIQTKRLTTIVDSMVDVGTTVFAVGIMPPNFDYSRANQNEQSNRNKFEILRERFNWRKTQLVLVPVRKMPEAADLRLAAVAADATKEYDRILIASSDFSIATVATAINRIKPTWLLIGEKDATAGIETIKALRSVPLIRVKDTPSTFFSFKSL